MTTEPETLLTRVKKLLRSACRMFRAGYDALRWYCYHLVRARYYALALRRCSNVVELLRSPAHQANRLIIFLVPGKEFISGGILSIFNLYRLSRTMEAIHGAHV